MDLLGALARHPNLANLVLQSATVEKKTRFDTYGGNPRNHDLVLRATTTDGEPVVVCVEAKAGEELGETVAKQIKAAKKARKANPRSNAPARIDDLVKRLCRLTTREPKIAALRYQLLTGWAGTLADAEGAAHAVFVLHEFHTNRRPEDRSTINGTDLALFAEVVLGYHLPGAEAIPWCVRVPDVEGIPASLYVAHVVTDLRDDAIAVATIDRRN